MAGAKLVDQIRLIALGVIIACVSPLPAQSPPLVVTVTGTSSDQAILTMQNLAGTTLIASLYTIDWSHAGSDGRTRQIREWAYRDAATERGSQPILSNQQVTRPTSNGGQVTLLAAIWADGSTFGEIPNG